MTRKTRHRRPDGRARVPTHLWFLPGHKDRMVRHKGQRHRLPCRLALSRRLCRVLQHPGLVLGWNSRWPAKMLVDRPSTSLSACLCACLFAPSNSAQISHQIPVFVITYSRYSGSAAYSWICAHSRPHTRLTGGHSISQPQHRTHRHRARPGHPPRATEPHVVGIAGSAHSRGNEVLHTRAKDAPHALATTATRGRSTHRGRTCVTVYDSPGCSCASVSPYVFWHGNACLMLIL
jgi:hypothetical protein